jgi:hypothetical protein
MFVYEAGYHGGNALIPYSGGLRFEYLLEHKLSSLRFSRFSSLPPGKFQDRTFVLGHDHFLPNISQFIINSSTYRSKLSSY